MIITVDDHLKKLWRTVKLLGVFKDMLVFGTPNWHLQAGGLNLNGLFGQKTGQAAGFANTDFFLFGSQQLAQFILLECLRWCQQEEGHHISWGLPCGCICKCVHKKNKKNKHNAELLRTNPGTKVTGEFSTTKYTKMIGHMPWLYQSTPVPFHRSSETLTVKNWIFKKFFNF